MALSPLFSPPGAPRTTGTAAPRLPFGPPATASSNPFSAQRLSAVGFKEFDEQAQAEADYDNDLIRQESARQRLVMQQQKQQEAQAKAQQAAADKAAKAAEAERQKGLGLEVTRANLALSQIPTPLTTAQRAKIEKDAAQKEAGLGRTAAATLAASVRENPKINETDDGSILPNFMDPWAKPTPDAQALQDKANNLENPDYKPTPQDLEEFRKVKPEAFAEVDSLKTALEADNAAREAKRTADTQLARAKAIKAGMAPEEADAMLATAPKAETAMQAESLVVKQHETNAARTQADIDKINARAQELAAEAQAGVSADRVASLNAERQQIAVDLELKAGSLKAEQDKAVAAKAALETRRKAALETSIKPKTAVVPVESAMKAAKALPDGSFETAVPENLEALAENGKKVYWTDPKQDPAKAPTPEVRAAKTAEANERIKTITETSKKISDDVAAIQKRIQERSDLTPEKAQAEYSAALDSYEEQHKAQQAELSTHLNDAMRDFREGSIDADTLNAIYHAANQPETGVEAFKEHKAELDKQDEHVEALKKTLLGPDGAGKDDPEFSGKLMGLTDKLASAQAAAENYLRRNESGKRFEPGRFGPQDVTESYDRLGKAAQAEVEAAGAELAKLREERRAKMAAELTKRGVDVGEQAGLIARAELETPAPRVGFATALEAKGGGVKGAVTAVAEKAPFAGGFFEVARVAPYVGLVSKLENGKELSPAELDSLTEFVRYSQREGTGWLKLTEGVATSLSFGAEMAGTAGSGGAGGAVVAAKKGAVEATKAAIKWALTKEGLAKLVKAKTDALLKGQINGGVVAKAIAAKTLNALAVQTPKFVLGTGGSKTLAHYVNDAATQGIGVTEQEGKIVAALDRDGTLTGEARHSGGRMVADALFSQAKEFGTEKFGAALPLVGKVLGRSAPKAAAAWSALTAGTKAKLSTLAMVRALQKLNPSQQAGKIGQFLRAASRQGLGTEILEERVGDVADAAYGFMQDGRWDLKLPTGEDFLVELGTLMIPGAAGAIGNMRAESKLNKALETSDTESAAHLGSVYADTAGTAARLSDATGEAITPEDVTQASKLIGAIENADSIKEGDQRQINLLAKAEEASQRGDMQKAFRLKQMALQQSRQRGEMADREVLRGVNASRQIADVHAQADQMEEAAKNEADPDAQESMLQGVEAARMMANRASGMVKIARGLDAELTTAETEALKAKKDPKLNPDGPALGKDNLLLQPAIDRLKKIAPAAAEFISSEQDTLARRAKVTQQAGAASAPSATPSAQPPAPAAGNAAPGGFGGSSPSGAANPPANQQPAPATGKMWRVTGNAGTVVEIPQAEAATEADARAMAVKKGSPYQLPGVERAQYVEPIEAGAAPIQPAAGAQKNTPHSQPAVNPAVNQPPAQTGAAPAENAGQPVNPPVNRRDEITSHIDAALEGKKDKFPGGIKLVQGLGQRAAFNIDDKSLSIDLDSFDEQTKDLEGEALQKEIETVIQEEWIHAGTVEVRTPKQAAAFWNKLTPEMQAGHERAYTYGKKFKGLTEAAKGYEAYRQILQQAIDGKITENTNIPASLAQEIKDFLRDFGQWLAKQLSTLPKAQRDAIKKDIRAIKKALGILEAKTSKAKTSNPAKGATKGGADSGTDASTGTTETGASPPASAAGESVPQGTRNATDEAIAEMVAVNAISGSDESKPGKSVAAMHAFWDSLQDGDTVEWTDGAGRLNTAVVEVVGKRKTKFVVSTTKGPSRGYEYGRDATPFIQYADTVKVTPKAAAVDQAANEAATSPPDAEKLLGPVPDAARPLMVNGWEFAHFIKADGSFFLKKGKAFKHFNADGTPFKEGAPPVKQTTADKVSNDTAPAPAPAAVVLKNQEGFHDVTAVLYQKDGKTVRGYTVRLRNGSLRNVKLSQVERVQPAKVAADEMPKNFGNHIEIINTERESILNALLDLDAIRNAARNTPGSLMQEIEREARKIIVARLADDVKGYAYRYNHFTQSLDDEQWIERMARDVQKKMPAETPPQTVKPEQSKPAPEAAATAPKAPATLRKKLKDTKEKARGIAGAVEDMRVNSPEAAKQMQAEADALWKKADEIQAQIDAIENPQPEKAPDVAPAKDAAYQEAQAGMREALKGLFSNRRPVERLQKDLRDLQKRMSTMQDFAFDRAINDRGAIPRFEREIIPLREEEAKLRAQIASLAEPSKPKIIIGAVNEQTGIGTVTPQATEKGAGGIEQLPVPEERTEGILKASRAVINAGIRTPEALAKFLDDTFPGGKVRAYSESIWDIMGIVDKSLRGTHDWTAVYASLEQPDIDPTVRATELDTTGDVRYKKGFAAAYVQPGPTMDALEALNREVQKAGDYGTVSNPNQIFHATIAFGVAKGKQAEAARAIAAAGTLNLRIDKLAVMAIHSDPNSPNEFLVAELVRDEAFDNLQNLLSPFLDTERRKRPHITVAVVKKGEGHKYTGNTSLNGMPVTFDSVVINPETNTGNPVYVSLDPAQDLDEHEKASDREMYLDPVAEVKPPPSAADIREHIDALDIPKGKGTARAALFVPHETTEDESAMQSLKDRLEAAGIVVKTAWRGRPDAVKMAGFYASGETLQKRRIHQIARHTGENSTVLMLEGSPEALDSIRKASSFGQAFEYGEEEVIKAFTAAPEITTTHEDSQRVHLDIWNRLTAISPDVRAVGSGVSGVHLVGEEDDLDYMIVTDDVQSSVDALLRAGLPFVEENKPFTDTKTGLPYRKFEIAWDKDGMFDPVKDKNRLAGALGKSDIGVVEKATWGGRMTAHAFLRFMPESFKERVRDMKKEAKAQKKALRAKFSGKTAEDDFKKSAQYKEWKAQYSARKFRVLQDIDRWWGSVAFKDFRDENTAELLANNVRLPAQQLLRNIGSLRDERHRRAMAGEPASWEVVSDNDPSVRRETAVKSTVTFWDLTGAREKIGDPSIPVGPAEEMMKALNIKGGIEMSRERWRGMVIDKLADELTGGKLTLEVAMGISHAQTRLEMEAALQSVIPEFGALYAIGDTRADSISAAEAKLLTEMLVEKLGFGGIIGNENESIQEALSRRGEGSRTSVQRVDGEGQGGNQGKLGTPPAGNRQEGRPDSVEITTQQNENPPTSRGGGSRPATTDGLRAGDDQSPAGKAGKTGDGAQGASSKGTGTGSERAGQPAGSGRSDGGDRGGNGTAGDAETVRPGGVEEVRGGAGNNIAGVRGQPPIIPTPEKPEDRNHRIDAGEKVAPRSVNAKIDANFKAIELLRTLEKEERNPNAEERAILEQYTGWGFIKEAFNTVRRARYEKLKAQEERYYGDKWEEHVVEDEDREVVSWFHRYAAIQDRLKAAFGDKEFLQAEKSVRNAHYTTPVVLGGMWDAVKRLGFRGGKAVEPGGGAGHAIGTIPDDLANRTRWEAVELDGITARLLAKLYPQVRVNGESAKPGREVRGQGFQDARIPNNSVDLFFSNVPFAKEGPGKSRSEFGIQFNLHNYFFARALAKTKPGGIIAFITSANTMESSRDQRAWLSQRAEFVGAIRLPNTAFKENAGTEVVTDIIFLRKPDGTNPMGTVETWLDTTEVGQGPVVHKRLQIPKGYKKEAEPLHEWFSRAGNDWIPEDENLREAWEKWRGRGKPKSGEAWKELMKAANEHLGDSTKMTFLAPIRVNEYFARHPEMVLGTHALAGSMYRPGEYTVLPKEGDLGEQMAAAIKNLPENIAGNAETNATQEVEAESGAREFSYVERDGVVYQNTKDGMEPVEWRELPGMSKGEQTAARTKLKKFRHFAKVRGILERLITAEANPAATDEELAPLRAELNAAYDAAFADYGGFSKAKRNPYAFLEDDPDYYNVQALDNETITTNDKGETVSSFTKSDIFKKRLIPPYEPPTSANSLEEAVAVSMAWEGRLNAKYVADLLGITEDVAKKQLLEQGMGFENPATGMIETEDEYLSGAVGQKLKQASEAAIDDPKYNANVAALRAALPARKPISQASVAAGQRWIPDSIYNAFARSLGFEDVDVSFDRTLNRYEVKGRHVDKAWSVNAEWGPVEILEAILNHRTLNVSYYDRQAGKRVRDTDLTALLEGKAREMKDAFVSYVKSSQDTVPDPNNPSVMQPVSVVAEEEFNDKVNSIVPPTYKGDWITLPNSAVGADGKPIIWLKPFRKAVLARFITEGRGMMAHGVGSGKTYNQIALAMELRRLGKARKPLMVVQGSTINQVAASFKKAYPNAKILVATPRSYSGAARKRFTARIATGDWDAVIMTHANIGMIPNKQSAIESYYAGELDELNRALEAVESRSDAESDLLAARDTLMENRAKVIDQMAKYQDNSLSWEDLGIDALIVDEAHAFKNAPVVTMRGREVKNIPTTGAGALKAVSMMMKTASVRERGKGKGVFFATGTPVSNTMAEAFIMMRYIAPDILAANNIYNFDDFANQYGDVKTTPEATWNGTVKSVDRFAKFINGGPLVNMIRSVFDVALGNENLGINVPDVKGGKPRSIIVEPSEGNQIFNDWILAEVGPAWKQITREDIENNPQLTAVPIMTMQAGIAAALDPRMIHDHAPDDPNSKVNAAIREVLRIHKEGTPRKTSQVIFADLFNPFNMRILEEFAGNPFGHLGENPIRKGSKRDKETGEFPRGNFNLGTDIKDKLVKAGVPASEVYVVTNETDEKLTAILDKVNSGEIRVVIGSTQKLGVGVNMQERLAAAHHLMPPRDFKPAMMEQRNGRIIRQGNLHSDWRDLIFVDTVEKLGKTKFDNTDAEGNPITADNLAKTARKWLKENDKDGKIEARAKKAGQKFDVEIIEYSVGKSLDSAIYSMMAAKAGMIGQVLSNHGVADEFDDPTDELAFNFAENAANIIGDANLIRFVTLDRQSNDLRALYNGWRSRKSQLEADERNYAYTIAVQKDKLKEHEGYAAKLAGIWEENEGDAVWTLGDSFTVDTSKTGKDDPKITATAERWMQQEESAREAADQKARTANFTVNGRKFAISFEGVNGDGEIAGRIGFGHSDFNTTYAGTKSFLAAVHSITREIARSPGELRESIKWRENALEQTSKALKADKGFPDLEKLRAMEAERDSLRGHIDEATNAAVEAAVARRAALQSGKVVKRGKGGRATALASDMLLDVERRKRGMFRQRDKLRDIIDTADKRIAEVKERREKLRESGFGLEDTSPKRLAIDEQLSKLDDRLAQLQKLQTNASGKLHEIETVAKGYSGRLSASARPMADDMREQEKWLDEQARKSGFADVEQLAQSSDPEDVALLERLAAKWRNRNGVTLGSSIRPSEKIAQPEDARNYTAFWIDRSGTAFQVMDHLAGARAAQQTSDEWDSRKVWGYEDMWKRGFARVAIEPGDVRVQSGEGNTTTGPQNKWLKDAAVYLETKYDAPYRVMKGMNMLSSSNRLGVDDPTFEAALDELTPLPAAESERINKLAGFDYELLTQDQAAQAAAIKREGVKQFWSETRDRETHRAWNQWARETFNKDPNAAITRIVNEARNGFTGHSGQQAKLAMLVLEHLSAKAAFSGDAQMMRDVEAITLAFDLRSTLAGREIAARWQPHATMEEQHRTTIAKAIYGPTAETRAKLDAAMSRASKNARIAELEAQVADLLAKAKKRMAKQAKTADDKAAHKADVAKLSKLRADLKAAQEAKTEAEIMAEQNKTRLDEVQKAFEAAGFTLEEVMVDRAARLKLQGSGMVKRVLEAFNPRERIAIRAIMEGKTDRVASTESGISRNKIGELETRFDAALDREVDHWIDRGFSPADMDRPDFAEFMDAKGGLFSPARPTLTPEERTKLRQSWKNTIHPPAAVRNNPARKKFKPSKAGGKAGIDIGKPEHAIVALRAIQRAENNAFDMMYEYWINGILSGPATHVANIAGNTANVILEYGMRAFIEAPINAALGKVGLRNMKGASFGEFNSMRKWALGAAVSAFEQARKAWSYEVSSFDWDATGEQPRLDSLSKDQKTGYLNRTAIPGRFGRIVRAPSRALLFMDEFTKYFVGVIEASAQAHRIALADGLEGKALDERVAELVRIPGSPAWVLALEKSHEMTFQQDLPKLLADAQNWLNKKTASKTTNAVRWALKFIFPFIKTPYNILAVGVRKTPLGTLNILRKAASGKYKDNGAGFQHDLAEQLLACVAMYFIAGMAEGDPDDDKKTWLITGTRGRDDRSEASLLNRSKGGETTILYKGKPVFHYGRYAPLATSLATVINAFREMKKIPHGKSKMAAAGSMLAGFVNTARSQTFLAGFDGLASFMASLSRESEGTEAQKMAKFLAQGVMPNLIRQPLRNTDDQVRDTKNAPWYYHMVPVGDIAEPLYDLYGRPVKKGGSALSRLLISEPTDVPAVAPGDKLLNRWNTLHPVSGEGDNTSYFPSDLTKSAFRFKDAAGKWKDMTPAEIREVRRRVGQQIGAEAASIGTLPIQENIDALKKARGSALEKVKKEMFPGGSRPAVKAAPSLRELLLGK